ncbi:hypothetical protein Tco_0553406 [Tanacetum coccineum]
MPMNHELSITGIYIHISIHSSRGRFRYWLTRSRWTKVPPSPDYIPGPEEPQSPPPLDFVPESDPEEEPEEDDEDPEEDPADYPADRDDDDDDEDEDEDEEEEEHPAPADSVPPVHRMTARISIREEQPLHAATSPTAESPGYIPESDPDEDPKEDPNRLPIFILIYNTPGGGVSIRDEPSIYHFLPYGKSRRDSCINHLTTITITPTYSSPYNNTITPLLFHRPHPNKPYHIEIPRLDTSSEEGGVFASPTPSREVGETREDLYGFVDMVDVPPRCSTSRELDYDITDTWDDMVGAIDEIAPTTVEGVNQRVTDLATIVEEETTAATHRETVGDFKCYLAFSPQRQVQLTKSLRLSGRGYRHRCRALQNLAAMDPQKVRHSLNAQEWL